MSPESNKTDNSISVLIVRIGDESYAVKALTITEIVPMMSIHSMPDLPDFLKGFIDIRGAIYPIMDLCKQFGGERKEYVLSNRIILMHCHKRNIGFIVDDIIGIEEWHPEMYQVGILSNEVEGAFTGEVGQTDAGDIQVLNLCDIISEEDLSALSMRDNV